MMSTTMFSFAVFLLAEVSVACVDLPPPAPTAPLPAVRRRSWVPDKSLWYTMSTAAEGDGNCLYALVGVDGSVPYPVRFEPCNPLRDDALWRFDLHGSGGYNIFNKTWIDVERRLDINCQKLVVADLVAPLGLNSQASPPSNAHKTTATTTDAGTTVATAGTSTGPNTKTSSEPSISPGLTSSTNNSDNWIISPGLASSTKSSNNSNNNNNNNSNNDNSSSNNNSNSNNDNKLGLTKDGIAGVIVSGVGVLVAVAGFWKRDKVIKYAKIAIRSRKSAETTDSDADITIPRERRSFSCPFGGYSSSGIEDAAKQCSQTIQAIKALVDQGRPTKPHSFRATMKGLTQKQLTTKLNAIGDELPKLDESLKLIETIKEAIFLSEDSLKAVNYAEILGSLHPATADKRFDMINNPAADTFS
ncbi:hypothetical protein B0T26DRAFT_805955 [Lasiosphaeria miniovina]|uniref:Ricin B lectin domain-containing protein n=1 Tax=Lasiosphaeria miniovina TaxID=1954250 RepID=A0AA40DN94_9PEZI|nr:uncharacterized protein B0T26DRAFT_805955 [Lasiosphaeria miniovina]KAK0706083.1 hypothetical protein B0T26DRAFT_805955 [Lasiosphaeria miniovina]